MNTSDTVGNKNNRIRIDKDKDNDKDHSNIQISNLHMEGHQIKGKDSRDLHHHIINNNRIKETRTILLDQTTTTIRINLQDPTRLIKEIILISKETIITIGSNILQTNPKEGGHLRAPNSLKGMVKTNRHIISSKDTDSRVIGSNGIKASKTQIGKTTIIIRVTDLHT